MLTAGLTLVGEYSFGSLTFKALERRADGVFEPVGHDGPVYLVEFQAQPVAHAWYNLLTKMGLYGEAHPLADVRAILIFLERFRTNTAEEIWTMLQHLTPLEETRAYQSIFVKGEAKGKVEGKIEGKAEGIKRLLARRFGPLPPWAEQRIATAPAPQLDAWIDGLLDAESVAALIGPE